MNIRIEKVIQHLALPIVAVAGILLVYIAFNNSVTARENNAYIRVINCIISENAVTRTQADIERCYSTVEKDLGVKLQRYDSSDKQ